MSLRSYPAWLLLATGLSSLLVLLSCGAVATYLDHEQSRTADVLTENIGSQKAAANLEETLTDLIVLHRRGAKDVEPLHDRSQKHLAEIHRFADKDQERELGRRIADGYDVYIKDWEGHRGEPARAAVWVGQLEKARAACQDLQGYNARQIDQSERDHRRSLRAMSWGLWVVGGLGSVAGLVLGYGLSHRLRRTIHRFLLRVQGASDLLGQELSTVEWQREGDPLGDGAEDLLRRVEQVVGKLQQREREVRRAERLAAVGQLAAGVAHEVRNPLTSVLLLLETARKDSAAKLTDEDLLLIEDELHRIERSIRTFLDYARPPKVELSACDLGAVVRDAAALLRGRADQQRVELAVECPPGCLLQADRDQLRQVVLNLALNALDAMPHGGTLAISARPVPGAGEVELAVADTGPGIPPAVLPRLFEPFATGKETGLGLGLVISKRIVEDHGGRVEGSNRPGGGACFVVRLPARCPAPTPVPAA